jgi:hypothetical protein
MRNNLQLYHKVLHQLCQWLPEERVTRQRNLALLVVGLYLSSSVHLSLIVRKWPMAGKIPSLVNRLNRFLNNNCWRVSVWYEPLATELIQRFAKQGLRLVIDTTKVGFDHRVLMVGVAYRRRTLPLAWSVHRGRIGNVAVREQLALLRRVYRLIPYDCVVHLVGDCSFAGSDLLRWLADHEWHFVIRQPGPTEIRRGHESWQPLRDLPLREGETRVIGWVWVAKTNPFGQAWLVLHWAKGEAAPWYLVADQPGAKELLRAYQRRMWVEEMFGDMKGHGFDLAATHLRRATRIERLLLGVCIAFVWLLTLGSWLVKRGYRHLLDPKSRRDKSYFRLGWDWIERCLRLGLPIRLQFRPYL